MTPAAAGFNLALAMRAIAALLLALPLLGCIDLSLPESHWDQAVFAQAVAANPQHAHAHFSLGRRAMRMGEYQDAIRHFERALAADPTLTEARLGIGRCLLNRGRASEALAPLRQAAEEAPRSPLAHALLGQALLEAGDPVTARDHLDQALALDGACFPALAARGEISYRNGELEQALSDWRRAGSVSLDDPVWLGAQRGLRTLAEDLDAYLRRHGADR